MKLETPVQKLYKAIRISLRAVVISKDLNTSDLHSPDWVLKPWLGN